MSLQINTFNSTTVTVKPKPVTRVFSVSPAIYGTTLWDIDQQSQLNVSSSGIWTLTPNIDFTASVKMWGAGGSGRSGSYEYSGKVSCGGAGGYTYGTMSFVKDQTYILVVGQGGIPDRLSERNKNDRRRRIWSSCCRSYEWNRRRIIWNIQRYIFALKFNNGSWRRSGGRSRSVQR